MSFINYMAREINCKIVYYGPGLCGKTTNLQYIYERTNPDAKGKMISLATETERTLFFDFLPLSLGEIRGFKTRFHLYTVPGQVFYDASRKLILKGVDGVIFVADSQMERLEANLEIADERMAEAVYAAGGLEGVNQLSKANEVILRRLLGTFAIGRDPVRASTLKVEATDPTERHIELCRAVGAKTYLSGQGAHAYNDAARFEAAGIALAYLSFEHPVYPQFVSEFVPGLSALDFLCRTGPQAPALFAAAVASAALNAEPLQR